MGKPRNGVPDRWEDYTNMGRQIPGTRSIAFKVPLKQELMLRAGPGKGLLSPRTLMDYCSNLGLIIDLTFTDRYYNPKDFNSQNIDHTKLMIEGHVVPTKHNVYRFFNVVEQFLELNKDNQKLIGVHCTHGVNRTGYMICRYMIQRLRVSPDQAISDFNSARGHEIERDNYLTDLRKASWMNDVYTPRSEEENNPCGGPINSPSAVPLPKYNRNDRNTWNPDIDNCNYKDDLRGKIHRSHPYSRNPPQHYGNNWRADQCNDQQRRNDDRYNDNQRRNDNNYNDNQRRNDDQYNDNQRRFDDHQLRDNQSNDNQRRNDDQYNDNQRRNDNQSNDNQRRNDNQSNDNQRRNDNQSNDNQRRNDNQSNDNQRRNDNQSNDNQRRNDNQSNGHQHDKEQPWRRPTLESSPRGSPRYSPRVQDDNNKRLNDNHNSGGRQYYEHYYGNAPQQYDPYFYQQSGSAIGPHRPTHRYASNNYYINPHYNSPSGGEDNTRPRQYRGPKQYTSPIRDINNEEMQSRTPSFQDHKALPMPESFRSPLPISFNTPKTQSYPKTPSNLYATPRTPVDVHGPSRNPFSPGAANNVFSPDTPRRISTRRYNPY